MMWILQLQNNSNNEDIKDFWYLFGYSKRYSVGRRQDNENQSNLIKLTGDKSVSREHAIIHLDSNGELFVEDLSSRYGTFFAIEKGGNLEKLQSKQKKALFCGNIVHFGALNNIWKVTELKLVVCTSSYKLNSDTENMLEHMCVPVLSNWTDECTHLTMSSITLTLKVLKALVAARPIVKPEFWKDFYDSLHAKTDLPEAQNYLPPVQEPTLNQQTANFHPDQSRNKVFNGKNFYFFMSSQMDKYNDIIIAASGKTKLIHLSKMKKSQLCSPNNIIIQYMNDEFSQDTQTRKVAFQDTVQYLNKNSYRIIPEAEIGLAILSNSLQKFCNPEFNFAAEILKSPTDHCSSETRNIEVFALETEPFATSPFYISSKQAGCSFITPVSNKYEQNKTNLSIGTERNSTINDHNENKQNRKTKRSRFDEVDEPPNKKTINTTNAFTFTQDRNKKNENTDNNEEIFNFENNINKPEINFNSQLNVQLRISNKKKNSDTFGDDEENLFNFLPTVSQETPKRILNKSKKICIDDSLEIIDKKRICLDKSQSSSLSFANNLIKVDNIDGLQSKPIAMENSRWISSKEPSSLSQVKREYPKVETKSNSLADEDEINSKMEVFNLKPAIIIINNNLIMKEKEKNVSFNSPSQTVNFKKFVKVKPLKPQTEIVPRSKYFIYEVESSNSTSGYQRVSGDEDECDFSLLDKNIKNSKSYSKKSRRL